ncbi:transcriptional regulator [Leptospira inadai serovar Lyme]|uniref:Transcriptional regulator n=1 Tax=Leptospira inadai serovar Lyme TaxID=293084 RepID=A0ABX4YDE4_9LEPT|nr:transcriptional regulator [Leptospira inadai serovar Lyme]
MENRTEQIEIVSESEYKIALSRIEILMNKAKRSKEETLELESLFELAESYEEKHFPFPPVSP